MEVDGHTSRIALGIPPYRVTTVELRMNEETATAYSKIHHAGVNELSSGGANTKDSKTGCIDTRNLRRLCHAAFNTELEKLANRARAATRYINKWHESGSDHGASFYFKIVRSAKYMPVYRDRFGMAVFIYTRYIMSNYL